MYNNDKYKNSLKGYFKLRSKGLSHLESLKHISNSKVKRKIDYKIKKEINKYSFVIAKKTMFMFITILCFIITLILVTSLLVNII